MSMPDLPSYPIPLDGAAHVITLPAPYTAHGLIVVNGGAVALSVTSSRGQHWTVAPGGRLEAPLPESVPIYTCQAAAADTTGTASATFTQALIPVESNTGIATTTLPDVLIMPFTAPPAPYTSLSGTITLTQDIQSLTIGLLLPSYTITAGTSTLIGATSGYIYWEAPSNAQHAVINQFSVPVYPAIDATLTLVINFDSPSSGAAIAVIGHRYQATASLQPSGALTVGLTSGQFPLPVTISGSVASVPPNYRAADYSAYQSVTNPTAAQNLAAIASIPAGAYYIEYDMGCDEPAGPTKIARLINTVAPQFLAELPYPGSRSGVITGYFSSTVWSLAVQNNAVITDNGTLTAGLRVWKI